MRASKIQRFINWGCVGPWLLGIVAVIAAIGLGLYFVTHHLMPVPRSLLPPIPSLTPHTGEHVQP